MLNRWVLLAIMLGAAGGLGGCAGSAPHRLVDLTYPFDQETVYWPGNKSFTWEKTAWGPSAAGYWYTSASFATSEHGGTHIDAPIHFAEGRRTVDQIPVDDLMAPAVVVDVRARCQDNSNYELTVADLLDWEQINGRMPPASVVFMKSGWGARWPDRSRYLGSKTPDDPRTLRFPGFSAQAVEFLVRERQIRGVGIDTASIDPGRSPDFPAHRILNGADVYALENVASLDQLPPRGATVIALPMKIRGGTGGPVRIVAAVPNR